MLSGIAEFALRGWPCWCQMFANVNYSKIFINLCILIKCVKDYCEFLKLFQVLSVCSFAGVHLLTVTFTLKAPPVCQRF